MKEWNVALGILQRARHRSQSTGLTVKHRRLLAIQLSSPQTSDSSPILSPSPHGLLVCGGCRVVLRALPAGRRRCSPTNGRPALFLCTARNPCIFLLAAHAAGRGGIMLVLHSPPA